MAAVLEVGTATGFRTRQRVGEASRGALDELPRPGAPRQLTGTQDKPGQDILSTSAEISDCIPPCSEG